MSFHSILLLWLRALFCLLAEHPVNVFLRLDRYDDKI